ncbi:DegT/DnrJ/EryC1/StrS family aminotransferase [Streptomyces virginiae]|uniref:DegT/DnrJ/EryC1/StrS family aminotransferase n=1 Tax=Streptomyces TaxID=1883 RepID=UPI002E2C3B1C|nr:DegT/DnrJ/EryC1/StrS family aminotransferase [Streptomyces sp. NBC_00239]WSX96986.1 DegT/DnrJ/EryC1/StrS family aminotransferase [Streptomyces goshikiensis]
MDRVTSQLLDLAIADGGTGNAEVVRTLEKHLASLLDAPYALCVSSGTAALVCALHAVGVQPGDRVAVSALGPSMTGLAVATVGAEPVFVDCRPGSYGLEADALNTAAKAGPLAAVIPVPMWGYWDEDPQVLADLRQRGIPVIVDAAQAPLLRLGPQTLAESADVICLSLHGRKPIKAGEGGACLTRNPELAERVLAVRNFGQQTKFTGTRLDPTGPFAGQFGSNFKINALGAAWALDQSTDVGALRSRFATLRKTAQAAFEATGIDWQEAPQSGGVLEHGGYGLVAVCADAGDAADMAHQLADSGIEVDTLRYSYAPMHHSPYFAPHRTSTPAASALAARAVACRLEAFPSPLPLGG